MNLGLGLLQTVLLGSGPVNLISRLGTDVIGSAIGVTTTSIVGVLGSLTALDNPKMQDFQKVIEDIDLEFVIQNLDKLIKEQPDDCPESVKHALMGVNDVLVNIDGELKIVKDAFEFHQSKYWNSWRAFDCKCNIETIKKHSELLHKRSVVLKDLLKIYNNRLHVKNSRKQIDQLDYTDIIEDLS
jgi:hypothetical protein